MKINGYLICIAFIWLFIVTPAFSQDIQREKANSFQDIIPSQIDKNPADLLNPHVKNSLSRNAFKSSSTASEYLPDSIIYYSGMSVYSRDLFSYDYNGNLLALIRQVKEEKGWLNSEMSIFTYSYDGKVLTELKQSWVDFFWERTYLRTYSYDNSGNMLTYLLQQWVSGHWNNYEKYAFSYNTGGDIISCLVQKWYGEDWLNFYLRTNSYNQDELPVESLDQFWNGSTWENAIRYLNTYNSEGLVIIAVTESWYGNKWVNTTQKSYTYDNNDNNLTYCEQFWGNDEWINFTLITSTYDIYSNKLNEIHQDWTTTWTNISKSTFTYNADNNRVSNIVCLWNNNAWENYTRAEYLYLDGLIRGIGYVWQESGWVHGDAQINPLIKEGNRDREFCQWWGSMVEVYYPRLYTGTAEQNEEKMFLAYPNPARDLIHVQLKADATEQAILTLFTVSGVPVLGQSLRSDQSDSGQITLQTDHLSPGLYIIELNTGKSTSVQKINITK